MCSTPRQQHRSPRSLHESSDPVSHASAYARSSAQVFEPQSFSCLFCPYHLIPSSTSSVASGSYLIFRYCMEGFLNPQLKLHFLKGDGFPTLEICYPPVDFLRPGRCHFLFAISADAIDQPHGQVLAI